MDPSYPPRFEARLTERGFQIRDNVYSRWVDGIWSQRMRAQQAAATLNEGGEPSGAELPDRRLHNFRVKPTDSDPDGLTYVTW